MAYSPHRHSVQEIKVDARVDNQQFLTTFHLMNANSGAAAGEAGSSQVLLESFRLNYQNHILPILSTSYQVVSYFMAEIIDAALGGEVPVPVTRPRKTVVFYNAAKRDVITGVDPGDKGQAVTVNRLPAHEVVRVFKKPSSLARGYFSGNYHRIGPWGEADHSDTEPEKWAPATVAAVNVAFESFRIAPLLDGGAAPDNAWALAVFSARFIAMTLPVVPDPLTAPPRARLGAKQITAYGADLYVGTQISRRFTPKGFISGK